MFIDQNDLENVVIGQFIDGNGDGVIFYERKVIHTYAPGTYIYGMEGSCCRISELSNDADEDYGPKGRMVLGATGDDNAPVVTLPSLLPMTENQVNVIDLKPFITDIVRCVRLEACGDTSSNDSAAEHVLTFLFRFSSTHRTRIRTPVPLATASPSRLKCRLRLLPQATLCRFLLTVFSLGT